MLFSSVDDARVSMRGSAENFAPKNRVSYKYWSSTACQAPLQQRALIIIIIKVKTEGTSNLLS